MADQGLRDRRGNLLGRIRVLSNGKLELRDRPGNLRGTYDPKSDQTRDRTGNLVGKGNLLATLL
jgi:hypothetical protein